MRKQIILKKMWIKKYILITKWQLMKIMKSQGNHTLISFLSGITGVDTVNNCKTKHISLCTNSRTHHRWRHSHELYCSITLRYEKNVTHLGQNSTLDPSSINVRAYYNSPTLLCWNKHILMLLLTLFDNKKCFIHPNQPINHPSWICSILSLWARNQVLKTWTQLIDTSLNNNKDMSICTRLCRSFSWL